MASFITSYKTGFIALQTIVLHGITGTLNSEDMLREHSILHPAAEVWEKKLVFFKFQNTR